ncbi:MAG: hypothetical protein AAF206_01815, partial [Bacteroidota bacterium]
VGDQGQTICDRALACQVNLRRIDPDTLGLFPEKTPTISLFFDLQKQMEDAPHSVERRLNILPLGNKIQSLDFR